ncbi:GIY-YIG nuclease family protein [Jiulongibacter sediminis]|uniref:GIY-YIG nuclease family protein n=1 Tax=Jiulongibacter sediminis TaxID=1605367 RepID=UPI0026EF3DF7|nr:GIY-YIG nuclease family protein [Jiulongibacter sediminis]
MHKEYHVYILLCSDGTYYTGMTSYLEQRMRQHQEAHFPKAYTARRRPLELQFLATFSSVFDAIEFEKKLKGWSGQKKKALIEGDEEKLKELARCRNLTHFKFCSGE